jgi:hypothetical protein
MATDRRAKAMCDSCGFVYPMRVMKLSSYDTVRCPQCFDGAYDLKNHPQNKPASLREDPAIQNARIDDTGRNLTWEQSGFTWDDITQDRWWQTI